ncbi:hypothetical protein HMPREF1869_00065 [Bacteroidales bacterium KA00251]|nr:hypothetical protein HMPREF1869_00065 [Bacteroidales bacterium KA00251]
MIFFFIKAFLIFQKLITKGSLMYTLYRRNSPFEGFLSANESSQKSIFKKKHPLPFFEICQRDFTILAF